MYTKEMLYSKNKQYKGTIDEFIKEIVEKHYYIEVQLWNYMAIHRYYNRFVIASMHH